MMGLLGTVFSRIDAAKRGLLDFVENPVASLEQRVGLLNDNARAFNELTSTAAQEPSLMGPASQRLAQSLADSYSPVGMVLPNGMNLAHRNLQALAKGERAAPVKIGLLTDDQFNQINAMRAKNGFEPLPSKEVHYIGGHHRDSRVKQGYLPQDILKQLMSGLDDTAKAEVDRFGRANLVSTRPRYDGYASTVNDTVALMPSGKKTIAEVYSVIPKGDKRTLEVLAKEKAGVLPGEQGGVSHFRRIEQNQPINSVVTNQDVRNWIAQDNAVGLLGLHANNTAMDRAKALGFVDEGLLHGTVNDFPAFAQSSRHSVYATDKPTIADIYATATGRHKGLREVNAGPNVIPLMSRGKHLEVSDFRDGSGGWSRENLAEKLGAEVPSRGMWKVLPEHGYQSAKVEMDDLGGRQVQYIFPDPTVLRSRFAAFDPARINENDLLGRADLGLLGLLAGGSAGAAYLMQDD